METGFDTYLQNQFASTVTPYPDPRPNDSVNNVQQTFFLNAIAGGDQLRMRTSLALNELWVVSAQTSERPAGVHELPARTQQGCAGKLPECDDGCDVDSGDGKFPEHGEQRRAAAWRARQRKLRARIYAVVHAWD